MTLQKGFPEDEFRARLSKAQDLMAQNGLAAILLTTEPEIRYFTGFLTRFWESPTRPWFLIIPSQGKPIAVIPGIGAHLMSQTWVNDIRTWDAPDYRDDGIGVLSDALGEIANGGQIGVPSCIETHLRMPNASWNRLQEVHDFRDDFGILQKLRKVKSPAEIEKIRMACGIADRAFARVPERIKRGTSLADAFRQFQILCLEEGADWVSYLAGGAGPLGYGDVISPANEVPLSTGDVLMLDTGVVWDGYFSDFDRNFAVGDVSGAVNDTYSLLLEAADAAFELAKPGIEICELYAAIKKIVERNGPVAGRLGHGLGMQLTEFPSLIAADHTVLEPGMVLTLEPGANVPDGEFLVHEENIVITQDGAEYLSTPAPRQMMKLA